MLIPKIEYLGSTSGCLIGSLVDINADISNRYLLASKELVNYPSCSREMAHYHRSRVSGAFTSTSTKWHTECLHSLVLVEIGGTA